MYNLSMDLLLGLSVVVLLLCMVALTVHIIALINHQIPNRPTIQTDQEDDTPLPNEERTIPLDQFTPDFTKPVTYKIVEDEDENIVDLESNA